MSAAGIDTSGDMIAVAGFCRETIPEGPPPYDVLTLYIATSGGRLERLVRYPGGTWTEFEDVFSTHGTDGSPSPDLVTTALSPEWFPGADVEHIIVSGSRGLFYGARISSSSRLRRTMFRNLQLPRAHLAIACASAQAPPRELHVCYVVDENIEPPDPPRQALLHVRFRPGSDPAAGALGDRTLVSPPLVPPVTAYWWAQCAVSGDVLHVVVAALTNGFGPFRLLYAEKPDYDGLTRFSEYETEVLDPVNRGYVERATPIPAPLRIPVHYGSTIKLRHGATDDSLHSHPFAYSNPGSSGQQQVTCFADADVNDLWRVRVAHGRPDGERIGQVVLHGDIIRLEHVATGRNLHSHSGFPSPVSGRQEVTCFGDAGVGDGNDDWRVDLAGAADWRGGGMLRLIHTATGQALSSRAGLSHPLWTLGQQEVACTSDRAYTTLWYVSHIVTRDARFVAQSAPTSLLPGQTSQVSLTMMNVGTETWTQQRNHRIGSQSPPDNQTWGTARAEVPGPVAPGESATFTLRITAPGAVGRYVFRWRMLREDLEWFGEFSPSLVIRVSSGNTQVPDAVGLGRRTAADMVRAAHLVPRFTGFAREPSEVYDQSPPAGTIVDQATEVTLRMSRAERS